MIDKEFVLIHGKIAHSLSRKEIQFYDKGYLCFSRATGAIIFLEKDNGQNHLNNHAIPEHKVEVITLRDKQFLIPGFVDTHFHAPQYTFMGNGGDLKLLEWLNKYTFPVQSEFKNVELAKKVYSRVVKRQLQNGTTYCSYFATIHAEATKVLAEECLKQGMRALVGKVCMDMNAPEYYIETTEESLASTEDVIVSIKKLCEDFGAAKRNLLVRPVVTPRFAVSCSMRLMEGLAALAEKHEVHFQTHSTQEKTEIEFVKKLFPESSCYVNVYEMAGLLGRNKHRAILAHCVHLTELEHQIIRKYDSGICLCVTSNVNVMSGLVPIRKIMNEGMKASLGTDVAGGYSLSMLDAMRTTMNLSKMQSIDKPEGRLIFAQIFFLATLGGAEVLSSEAFVGNFVPGKQFDGLIVSMEDDDSQNVDVYEEVPQWYELQHLLEKFVFCGDDRSIKRVFVNGREVHTRK